ncbi:MAG: pilus assembly protein [Chloroflexi bacterium]|nr:pilus assembly protein [Chloroflexota bacterium]
MKLKLLDLKRKERGQSFVEFGISFLFLLLLACVVIDLGWVFYSMIAMHDAVEEGATFASLCQNTAKIVRRMQDSATAPLDISDINDYKIEYLDMDGNVSGVVSYGHEVRVSLTVQHQVLVPFISAFIGNRGYYPLSVSATHTIMQLDTVCNP